MIIIIIKQKSVFTLFSLIMSYTKVSKLYFYKCAHFLLVLSLSIVIIRQFHSFSKSLTLISLIPTLITRIPTLITRITITPPSRSPIPHSGFYRFHIGQNKMFHFRVWSISYDCLHDET